MSCIEVIGPGTDVEWYQLDDEQYNRIKRDPSSIRELLDELDLSNESGAFVDKRTTFYVDGQPLFSFDDSRASVTSAAPNIVVNESQFNIGQEDGPFLVRLIPANGTWLRLELEQDFDISKVIAYDEQSTFLGVGTDYCIGKLICGLNYAEWEEGEFEFYSTISKGESFALIDGNGNVEELDFS